jgi:single-strand DNA-binding protein
MTDTITLIGLVATTPNHIVTGTGLSITNFRLASHQRRYDRSKQEWVDGDTNWYTVTSFRQLATNVVASIQKGQRVVVTGRLRVRDWSTDEKTGTSIEVDAEAIGHDLNWGTTSFTRSAATVVAEAEGAAGEDSEAEPATDTDPDDESAASVARDPEAVGAATPF